MAPDDYAAQRAAARAKGTDATGATGDDETRTPPPPPREDPTPEPPPVPGGEWQPPKSGQLKDIYDSLDTLIGGVALGFFSAGDFHCYTVLAERGPMLAQTWTEAAGKNPQVKKVLLRLVEGGAWGQVIFATLSVAIPIADHHGAWPLPNPWAIMTTPADHADDDGRPQAAAPFVTPAPATDDEVDAAQVAEAQRRNAEERRKAQG